MTFKESRILTAFIMTLAVLAAYCVHVFAGAGRRVLDAPSLGPLALTMLGFIGITIAGGIVTLIVFHIAYAIGLAVRDPGKGEEEIGRAVEAAAVEDEMDRLIELKSSHASLALMCAGFMGALVSLAFGATGSFMLHVMFFAFFGGGLAGELFRFIQYRRGSVRV